MWETPETHFPWEEEEPWDDAGCGPEYWMYKDFGLPPRDLKPSLYNQPDPDDVEEL